jgi:hypothetical protein
MRTIARRLLATMIVGLAVGHWTAAQAVPFEELSGGKRALYTARAVVANTVPGASAATEPRCIQGYILCKLTFALFSTIVAGETLALGGGGDMAQPKAILYRGWSGDWVVTPRDIAGETKPELLPEPPPPAGGQPKEGGDFKPPPL